MFPEFAQVDLQSPSFMAEKTRKHEIEGVCKEFCVNGFCDQNSGSLSSNMMLN